MRMPRLVLYPFLGAVYPVLALAAANPGEIPGPWVFPVPLGISLSVCLCAWLVLGLFTRDPDRRAFLALLVVTLFASYGYFAYGLAQTAWGAAYATTALPVLIVAAYLGAIGFLVLRLVRTPRQLTRFLTILTAILVAWNTALVLRYAAPWAGLLTRSRPLPARVDLGAANPRDLPDIYLIVLDKYSGSRSLRASFGYDNGEFEGFLRQRGFLVPRAPQANYIYTMLALASLLNYRYLDDLSSDPGAQNRNKAYLNRVIEDNAVWRFLRARQYRLVFFPTVFPFTGGNRFADLQIPPPQTILTEFEIVWRRTTLAEPIISWLCRRISCAPSFTLFTDEAKLLEWRFDQLSRLPGLRREGRPLFVFAHLIIPHEPYVFNADCSHRPPFLPSYTWVEDETPEKQAYVAQISCLNSRLKSVVDHLLSDSAVPPIILLQSDHGHGRMPLHIPGLEAVPPDRVAERADIFAAYYLPRVDKSVVYDSITPVNLFPTVFREYFHADLARLPDKTYWSPGTNPFEFTRVNHGRPWPE